MRAFRRLSTPTYLVALVFMVIPFLDVLVSVYPLQFANIRWRVALMGQLSGGLMTVLLGFLLALAAATLLEQPRMQRAIVALSALLGLLLLATIVLFVLDIVQLRPSVRPEVRRAFDIVATQAFGKLLLSLVASVLFVLAGLRASRELLAGRRARGAEGPVVMVGSRGSEARASS